MALPGEAETTLALEQHSELGSDPHTMPAVVVYARTGGLTEDDLAAVADDAAAFGRLSELDGEVTGPIPSEDGEAAQLVQADDGPVGLGVWMCQQPDRPGDRGRHRLRPAPDGPVPRRAAAARRPARGHDRGGPPGRSGGAGRREQVVLGMLCLVAADMNSTRGLGPVAAMGVGVTLIVLMTLLPALLVICGGWVFWPMPPALGSPEPSATGLWARVGGLIRPCPRGVWVLTTLPLTFLTQLGIAVALGALLDTIVVRSVLVTALNLDVDRDVVAQPARSGARRAGAGSRGRQGRRARPHATAARRGTPGDPARRMTASPGRPRRQPRLSLSRPSRTFTETSIGVPAKPNCSRSLRCRNRR